MPIEIHELRTSLEVTPVEPVLSAPVLARIVAAVIAELDAREHPAQARATELDLRSVVQQQRSKAGG